MNFLDRWRRDDGKVSPEKQRMIEALARLGGETKQIPSPSPVQPRKAGRLIMALDLTGSREHSLKQARIATASMFDTIKALGAVAVKLVYFRGGGLLRGGECRASGWHDNPDILCRSMRGLSCKTGYTQIARVLRLALAEKETVSGVVYIGDHCEDEPDELHGLARALGRKSIPLFIFHECDDIDGRSLEAQPVFEAMAELSGGVYVEFKPDSGAVLKEILANVAAFAAAGAEGVRQAPRATTPEARQLQGRLCLLAAPAPESDKPDARAGFWGQGNKKSR
jgi:hypothetical protein